MVSPSCDRAVRSVLLAVPLLASLLLTACPGPTPAADAGTPPLFTTPVLSAGGVFSEPGDRPRFSVEIPAGAMEGDGRLTVNLVTDGPPAGPGQTFASEAFAISLSAPDGTPLTLARPVILTLTASAAPVHPQLGEIAERDEAAWVRTQTSFFKASSSQVKTLLRGEVAGTYRVVFRTLRATTDAAAIARGRTVMMDETFGNQAFFTAIGLPAVLNGLKPVDAVALGVQVDLTRLQQNAPAVVALMTGTDFAGKTAALNDPATTVALLAADAVIGVKATVANGRVTSAGITCALCHVNAAPTNFQLSATGPATALPIGAPQFDGRANARIDSGKILGATAAVQQLGAAPVVNAWGPGRFDVRALWVPGSSVLNAFEDEAVNPTDNPPLWNFVDFEAQGGLLGYDGLFKGPNALASQAEAVFDVVMHGNGAFGVNSTLPLALRVNPPARILTRLAEAETAQTGNDLGSEAARQKLLDLQTFMQSITSPAPGPFDEAQAEQGWRLFNNVGERAACSNCHFTAELAGTRVIGGTENAVTPRITSAMLGGDLAGGIRIPQLRGVSHSAPYFHNGEAATLRAVVDRKVALPVVAELTEAERTALVEYLKSL